MVPSPKYPQCDVIWVCCASHEGLVFIISSIRVLTLIFLQGAGGAKRQAEASPDKSPEAAKRPRLGGATDNSKPVPVPPTAVAPAPIQPASAPQPTAPGGLNQLPKYILDHPQAKRILEHMRQSAKALQDSHLKVQQSRQANSNPAVTSALEAEYQKIRENHVKLTDGARRFFAGIQNAHNQQQQAQNAAAGGSGPSMNAPAPSSVPQQRPSLSGSPKVQPNLPMSGPPQIPPGATVPLDVQTQMQKLVEQKSRQQQRSSPQIAPMPSPVNPPAPGSARVIVWKGQITIRSSLAPLSKDVSASCLIHAPSGINLYVGALLYPFELL